MKGGPPDDRGRGGVPKLLCVVPLFIHTFFPPPPPAGYSFWSDTLALIIFGWKGRGEKDGRGGGRRKIVAIRTQQAKWRKKEEERPKNILFFPIFQVSFCGLAELAFPSPHTFFYLRRSRQVIERWELLLLLLLLLLDYFEVMTLKLTFSQGQLFLVEVTFIFLPLSCSPTLNFLRGGIRQD